MFWEWVGILLSLCSQCSSKREICCFVSTKAETKYAEAELKPGISLLGHVNEKFFQHLWQIWTYQQAWRGQVLFIYCRYVLIWWFTCNLLKQQKYSVISVTNMYHKHVIYYLVKNTWNGLCTLTLTALQVVMPQLILSERPQMLCMYTKITMNVIFWLIWEKI